MHFLWYVSFRERTHTFTNNKQQQHTYIEYVKQDNDKIHVLQFTYFTCTCVYDMLSSQTLNVK